MCHCRCKNNHRCHCKHKHRDTTKCKSILDAISNLQQHSDAMDKKGICIEDKTASYTPMSHYPLISTDTFPSVWPTTAYPIKSMRIFSYSQGNVPAKQWALWAIKNNIKILIGINLQNYTSDLDTLSADYLAADPALKQKFEDNILAYAVGNEAGVGEIPNMIAGITYARNLITGNNLPNKPVSSVLSLTEQWITNTYPPENGIFTADFLTLEPNLDIIMFNAYGGYFLYIPELLDASLSWTSNGQQFSVLLNQFGAIRSAMSKACISKELWITETGWSSAPVSNAEPTGWSTPDNQRTFYKNFLNFNMNVPFLPQEASTYVMPPERIFWFSVRDSYYALLNINEYFGLYTEQESPLVQKI